MKDRSFCRENEDQGKESAVTKVFRTWTDLLMFVGTLQFVSFLVSKILHCPVCVASSKVAKASKDDIIMAQNQNACKCHQ